MASGQTIGTFFPGEGVGPATTPATLLALANGRYTIQYASTGASYWFWEWIVPDNYSNATGVTATIWWAGNTATSGNVIWTVYFELTTAGGTAWATDNWDSTNNDSAASATNAVAGIPVSTTIAVAKGSTTTANVVAHSRARVRIARRIAAGDTMSGFANFHGLEMTET